MREGTAEAEQHERENEERYCGGRALRAGE